MIKRLLNKYWSGKSTNQEKKSLLELLSKKSVLENELHSDSNISISPEKSKVTLRKIHTVIHQENSKEGKTYSINFLIKISAAVIILLFTIVGLNNYFSSTSSQENAIIKNELITIHNEDLDKSMNLKLSDESTIILYPNSKISYNKNYNTNNRTIKLYGKAKFIVAKNKELPFIVSTSQFSTTALGTIFIVDEQFSKNESKVELLEGKVVVQALDINSKTFKPTYLITNQSITINNTNYTAIVKNTSKIETIKEAKRPEENTLTIESKPIKEKINPKDSESNNVIYFDKAPLNEVFNRLSVLYGVDIKYNNSTSKELTFTGEINGEIEIHQHLKIICQLNELKLTEQQKQFTITK